MNFKPISTLQLNRIKQAVEEKYDLTIPTYKTKLPGGNVEVHKHDAKTIADKTTSQIEKDEWEAYQNQLQEMQAEINEKSTAYMFYEGVDCEASDEWIAKQEWLGVRLPDNMFDLKVRYVTTELLKTPFDIKNATVQIMQLSMKGVDSSVVKAAEATFSDILETK